MFVQVDLLRERLKEKEDVIDKRGKAVTQAQNDKKRIEGDMNDVRDHLDIKDRKINVLRRKVSVGCAVIVCLCVSGGMGGLKTDLF